MKNIAFVTTNYKTINWFLLPLIEDLLQTNKFNIFVFANFEQDNFFNSKNLKYINIPIKRKINLFFDFITLFLLIY